MRRFYAFSSSSEMNARGARNAQLIEGSPQAEVPQEADVSDQAEEEGLVPEGR